MQPIQSNNLVELRKLKGLVIDMDGVLWQGDTPMPGLHEFFDVLKQRQIKFVLATNNNTQTPEGFVQKAGKLGVEVLPEQVVTAAVATVHYLCSKYPPGSRIYVVGEAALKGLIFDAGFILADSEVNAVVATMDRQFTETSARSPRPWAWGGIAAARTHAEPFQYLKYRVYSSYAIDLSNSLGPNPRTSRCAQAHAALDE